MPASSARRAKIVCTLGPATRSRERIAALIEAGMDVARLNFSHGTHDFHRETFKWVREAARDAGKNVAIMQDLQGPKIRVGALPEKGLAFAPGDRLVLHPEGDAPAAGLKGPGMVAVPVPADIFTAVFEQLREGSPVLFDDGRVITRAIEARCPRIVLEVRSGRLLTSHKGINLPGTPLNLPCCTEKDIVDLKLGLELGVDAVALSFVRSPADIRDLRERIRKGRSGGGGDPLVVAKIEREEAVELHEMITEVSDALLIARGDMAVELGADRVPIIQKKLIRSCNELGVPIITATQMLESMVGSPMPTRAEASDVANAILDGTDAVMLSGETASGQYPVEAVETMARIVLEAERDGAAYRAPELAQPIPGSVVDCVLFRAARVAQHVGATAIFCITHSGKAARTLAKFRPRTPIVAIMDRGDMLRKLAFSWGVQGILIDRIEATDDLFKTVEEIAVRGGRAADGDLIVVTAGLPALRRGTTNTIKVHKIGAQSERVR